MKSQHQARRLRVLDLFCGAGGAAMGLHRAWPDAEIIGVDINPQPRYPFKFILADAMTFALDGYDLTWASPPCQRYSQVTPLRNREDHPDHIRDLRLRLKPPYVIENVSGARNLLENPFMLCGSMFGLRSQRHRWFEVKGFSVPEPPKCNHLQPPLLVTTAGANSRAIRQPGHYKSVKNAPLAYGIDWMDFRGLKEAIPPAYSEWIAINAKMG